MKKILFLGFVAVMTATVSIAAFASKNSEKAHQPENISVEMSAQGRGACTYSGCKCQKFNQRPGYYQCWCGHQSFVHK